MWGACFSGWSAPLTEVLSLFRRDSTLDSDEGQGPSPRETRTGPQFAHSQGAPLWGHSKVSQGQAPGAVSSLHGCSVQPSLWALDAGSSCTACWPCLTGGGVPMGSHCRGHLCSAVPVSHRWAGEPGSCVLGPFCPRAVSWREEDAGIHAQTLSGWRVVGGPCSLQGLMVVGGARVAVRTP